jgi:hypothetical protein
MVKNQDGGDQLQHFQHFTNCQILNKHHRARKLRDSPFKRWETREYQREVQYRLRRNCTSHFKKQLITVLSTPF